MSKKSYNAYGVPWYARSDTPAIRSRPLPELPQHEKNRRANMMQAKFYVVKWIRENWTAGERFTLTEEVPGTDPKQYITWSGKFVEIKYSGINYMVSVELDEGQKRKNGNRFGAFQFYHNAEKADTESPQGVKEVEPS